MIIDGKPFKFNIEQKQVSLTGARCIILIMALLESPKTFQELKEIFIECGVIEKRYSIDSLRVDINTLKAFGCDIPRLSKKPKINIC